MSLLLNCLNPLLFVSISFVRFGHSHPFMGTSHSWLISLLGPVSLYQCSKTLGNGSPLHSCWEIPRSEDLMGCSPWCHKQAWHHWMTSTLIEEIATMGHPAKFKTVLFCFFELTFKNEGVLPKNLNSWKTRGSADPGPWFSNNHLEPKLFLLPGDASLP